MRFCFLVLVLLGLGCSHHAEIGPDDGGGGDVVDGALIDVVPTSDAADATPGDMNTSGSRLKLVMIAGPDGSKQLTPFLFDVQMVCYCQWVPTGATSFACAPLNGCVNPPPQSTWAPGTPSTL